MPFRWLRKRGSLSGGCVVAEGHIRIQLSCSIASPSSDDGSHDTGPMLHHLLSHPSKKCTPVCREHGHEAASRSLRMHRLQCLPGQRNLHNISKDGHRCEMAEHSSAGQSRAGDDVLTAPLAAAHSSSDQLQPEQLPRAVCQQNYVRRIEAQ